MNTTTTRAIANCAFAPALARPLKSSRFSPVLPATCANRRTTARSIAQPAPEPALAEGALVGALAFAAASALFQAIGVMLRLAPPWEGFSGWISPIVS